MHALATPKELDDSESILIAGAGGGFDIYAGIPLYEALLAQGKKVTLANLSFSYLEGVDVPPIAPFLYRIDAETTASRAYFPEGVLARFYKSREQQLSVYAFEKTGALPLLDSYKHLVESHGIDAVVLVDGGTDILMRGDEVGLGTPEEDMASLAAASQLTVATKLVMCLGFGIDTFHGVCHASFLENVAALSRSGAFWGTTSLLPSMPEAQVYLDAVRFSEAHMADHSSIVNTSIASAIEGRFGDVQRTERTRSSELFISPLMSVYWAFDLMAVAESNLYLASLLETETIWDVQLAIEAFRADVKRREYQSIPH